MPALGRPPSRQPRRLEQGALVQRAVAEEGSHHLVATGPPGRPCRTNADWRRRAHDRVDAEDAETEIGCVHRAAAAAIEPGRLARQLGEHAARIRALGKNVPVPAVGACDEVGGPQRRADPDGDGLLADVGMSATDDLTGFHQFERSLLELPY